MNHRKTYGALSIARRHPKLFQKLNAHIMPCTGCVEHQDCEHHRSFWHSQSALLMFGCPSTDGRRLFYVPVLVAKPIKVTQERRA